MIEILHALARERSGALGVPPIEVEVLRYGARADAGLAEEGP